MITTYDELQTAIGEHSHKPSLSARFPEWIQLAETTILRELKLRTNELQLDGTTSSAAIPFPETLGRIVRLEITQGGARYALDFAAPGFESASTGQPSAYTVQEDAIRLIPAPSGTFSYSLNYIPNLEALSDDNPSNWALANCPDVYLYGAMCQLARWTKDDDEFNRYLPMFQGAMDAVKRVDEARRLPVSGGLQIKPRSYR
jgi:hypothetical protein